MLTTQEQTVLPISEEKIDPSRLIDGKAPSVVCMEQAMDRKMGKRVYRLAVEGVPECRVQLNHGKHLAYSDDARDEERLTKIAEGLLAKPDAMEPVEKVDVVKRVS